ncbi:hypothetical protein IMSHALPRED_004633 [Imshaugia aleurites]|uniref:NAD(P)-binding protein n=1 Tax=Imshaugia aleurites TaxID=172621 RepID=A0A8H3II13_9LECA|nr:hypothetical protein IMSHALPRED_004633 [Imshaugia aleurites]
MTKPWLLVSPASRGIGLQLARRLLKTTDLPVIATARNDVKANSEQILDGLDVDERRLEVLKLDVTDESTISDAASHCKSRFSSSYLRLAFCIPGILHPEKSPSQIDYDNSLSMLKINTLGPLLLSKHFSPFLARRSTKLESIPDLPASSVLALMSARVGSTSDNRLGGWYSYRASKAAVNSIAKSVDIYLGQRCGDNAMCVAMHPGTVKSGLSYGFWESTPKEKLFTPEFAAEKLIQVVKDVGLDGRGKCWDWQGLEVPP